MGWLRDLMEQSDSGCRSYGDLARSALQSGEWPTESRMAERSLASIFSKLDRNQETEWLAERVGVQRVLSKVLGVSLDDLRAPSSVSHARQDVRRLRLTALRFARALDLVDEPLCPGLPSGVLTPGRYQNLFWRAPSGSGRSLVGRYLEARGLAHVIEAATFEEALLRLPERGPVYIELYGQPSQPLPPSPRSELCVAGDFDPRHESWHVESSPTPESYLEELVAWVAARLPADGRFDAPRALDWLREDMLESGILDGLGAALGLCGLADEWGVHPLRGKSPHQLAQRFCRDRLSATVDPEATHAAWLKRNGYDVLLGMGRRLLADSHAPWDTPRSLDGWLELVPLEHQRDADVDWMRLSLAQTDSNIRPSDIEKAARKLPPGAFRIVRGFERSDLLQQTVSHAVGSEPPPARLTLGPRWFSNALRLEATRALLGGSPNDFGEALLKNHSAPRIARELLQRLAVNGSAFIESVLEVDAADSAGHTAALEMTFRTSGVALLGGAEFSSESLEALWDEALSARLEFPNELPCPRIEYPDPERDALLSRGIWYLAAFAISSELGQRAGVGHGLLRPWRTREVSPALRELCALIARDLPTHLRDRAWVLRAFSLISRLRAEIGALGALDRPEALEQPTVILDEVTHGVLTWASVAKIADGELGLPALRALASERGLAFSSVASAIWQAWDEAQRPALGAHFLNADSPHASGFWPHIPGALLQGRLREEPPGPLPYENFGEAQWLAFSEALEHAPARANDPRALACAPDFVLQAALQRGLDSPALFACTWQRAPERASLELVRSLQRPDDADVQRLRGLLEAAPDAHFPRLIEGMARVELANLPRGKLSAVRHFLHDRVRSRKPGYGEAYARLSEIERQLSHAR